jgi:Protein of unknown function (DUF3040)
MALSMDEQRILDEIERGLASADPGLATRLAGFGAPRAAFAVRMRRIRLLASFSTLLVVAVVSLVVYAVMPFRAAGERHAGGRASASPSQPVQMAPSHATGRPSAQASSVAASRVPGWPSASAAATASHATAGHATPATRSQ